MHIVTKRSRSPVQRLIGKTINDFCNSKFYFNHNYILTVLYSYAIIKALKASIGEFYERI